MKRLAMTTVLVVVVAQVTSIGVAEPPYPPSSVIKSITWHWDTHTTAAPGSDLWPVTWASDGNIYTAWGDGGGFGGTNSDGRVSMGFARIKGAPESYVGINVNGGKNPEAPASFPTKCKTGGMLSVDGTLYARLNLQDGEWPDVNFGLAWSEDLGATWTKAPWVFPKGAGNFKPSRFLNFGKDHAGVPAHLAGFVYFYGFKQDTDSGSDKSTYMGRVPQGRIEDRSAYEFFKGLDANGKPIWTSDVKDIQPVFTDPNGTCLGGVVYNPGIKRYILTSFHTGPGQLGVFDSPQPWGPWTTVAYYDSWGNMGTTGFGLNCDFPQKWMSVDGLTMWSIFSVYGDGARKGIDGHDRFNLVKATLMLLSNEDYGNGNRDNDRIQIYKENPRYWQYKDKPVLLARRGGARDATLFIRNDSVAATVEFTAKSARSVTLQSPNSSARGALLAAEESTLPYGNRQGSVRVIYDNDQTKDVYTDEILMAMASAGRIQLTGMITTRTVNGIGYDEYDELVAERKQMVNLARKSGMKHLPAPVKGPRVSLQPPASGKIEDTKTIGSDGSRLIVREARKASSNDPLIVICGGQLTAIADAYLLDPSI